MLEVIILVTWKYDRYTLIEQSLDRDILIEHSPNTLIIKYSILFLHTISLEEPRI